MHSESPRWRTTVAWRHALWLAPIFLIGLAGCQQMRLDARTGLAEPRMSQQSVVLDLFFVRLPPSESDESLWSELDEQVFAPALRQQLLAYGFRAGVCGAHPPARLEKLLNDMPVSAEPESDTITDLQTAPIVSRRHIQLPPGHRSEVTTSEIYETLPLLETPTPGQVSGSTYAQAQTAFTLQAHSEPDGSVRLKLLPEIQYGEAKPEIMPLGKSHFRFETRRPRKSFDQLALDTPLAPGEMLILSTFDNRLNSAGYYFFTEKTATGVVRKLLILRVSQTQHDSALAARNAQSESAPSDEFP